MSADRTVLVVLEELGIQAQEMMTVIVNAWESRFAVVVQRWYEFATRFPALNDQLQRLREHVRRFSAMIQQIRQQPRGQQAIDMLEATEEVVMEIVWAFADIREILERSALQQNRRLYEELQAFTEQFRTEMARFGTLARMVDTPDDLLDPNFVDPTDFPRGPPGQLTVHAREDIERLWVVLNNIQTHMEHLWEEHNRLLDNNA